MIVDIQQQIAKQFQEQSIAILGYGVEWRSTIDFLLALGIDASRIALRDQSRVSLLERHQWISVIYWEDYLNNLEQYDSIFRTAGLSPHQPELIAVKDKLTSQMQLFFDFFLWKTIVITGTKWKSTTTAMIAELLEKGNISHALVGNIGIPVWDIFLQDDIPDWAVIEISSYQWDGLVYNPDIAILTSLYPEHHIERHWSKSHYYQVKCDMILNAKQKLIASQVWSTDTEIIQELLFDQLNDYQKFGASGRYHFEDWNFLIQDKIVASDRWMKLLWLHNRYNACAALWVADILGMSFDLFQQTIQKFVWLDHRLEYVWEYAWIHRYDDAISTTPESSIAAIDSFGEDLHTIFLWWKDGNYDFQTLAERIHKSQIKTIILFPDSGRLIRQILGEWYNYFETRAMSEAVQFARKHTPVWKIALLSCASPSYSIWENYIEKWELFQETVRTL